MRERKRYGKSYILGERERERKIESVKETKGGTHVSMEERNREILKERERERY